MACAPPEIIVGGVAISTSDFENAKEIISTVSNDDGDPTQDEYEESIANGNNDKGTEGIQFPPSTQTSPPGEIKEEAKETDEEPPPEKEEIPVVCTTWDGDYSFQLSPNFQVREYTIGALYPNQLIDYAGYTKEVRCCNLQALSTNVGEAMLKKFGKFRINSGLRNSSSSASVSQHIKGEAVDIQFPGWNYERYWQNAEWIKNNIPFDQFIFEHSSSTGLAWYHLSYKNGGNRGKVLTMYKNNYSPGLRKYF